MSMIGICSICGRPANMSCSLCGRLVCAQDADPVTKVCKACAGKQRPVGRFT